MPAGYTVSNSMGGTLQNLGSSYITLNRLVAAASGTKRFAIFEIDGGPEGAPNATDCSIVWDLAYCSAAGAGTTTAATPQPLVSAVAIGTPADVSVTTAGINYTGEPTTYTAAECWYHKALNQRIGPQYQCVPGYEFYMPATASVGPGLRAKSSNYASTASVRLNFFEV
jgi:hypothetical protein